MYIPRRFYWAWGINKCSDITVCLFFFFGYISLGLKYYTVLPRALHKRPDRFFFFFWAGGEGRERNWGYSIIWLLQEIFSKKIKLKERELNSLWSSHLVHEEREWKSFSKRRRRKNGRKKKKKKLIMII